MVISEFMIQFWHYTISTQGTPYSHCSWKLQMDGRKNAETYSMDFHTHLVILKGWKKQFENLLVDF